MSKNTATTTTSAAAAAADSSHVIQPDGIWIGIDLGTSNCATAVWDSTRGRPKWMRLQNIAVPQENKAGRIVPSAVVVCWDDEQNNNNNTSFPLNETLKNEIQELNHLHSSKKSLQAHIGQVALSLQQDDSHQVITSIKRILSVCDTSRLDELDPTLRDSLPFELSESKVDGKWVVEYSLAEGDNEDTIIYIRPIHVAAILLHSLRMAAQSYLQKHSSKKAMQVPGIQGEVQHVVIGVPAYFGQSARHSVEQAARLAGFHGHVSTLTESTAAAMSYGLFVARAQKSILVLDMGGGTTDITIAEMQESDDGEEVGDNHKFKVLLTEGDPRLGGDDMDHALCECVLSHEPTLQLTHSQRQSLTRSCQRAKECLCGNPDQGDLPADSTQVTIPSKYYGNKHNTQSAVVTLKQSDLEEALEPILLRLRDIVQHVLQRYEHKKSNNTIQEVILIGGATRVPAVRRTLQNMFPSLELCTSVNAMSAVAQGTAIQAAILSKEVPLHQIQSALMLDTTPHAIGVLSAGGDFCEILPRDSTLPAQGYATFSLSDIHQRGVTVQAVEQVIAGHNADTTVIYQPLGDFTFLLHRIQDLELKSRQVDIGMTLTTDGEFHVSIFDPHDPDHQRKKRFQGKEVGVLDYVQAAATEGSITSEEIKLVLMAALLFFFYIFAKVVLSKDDVILEEGARIL